MQNTTNVLFLKNTSNRLAISKEKIVHKKAAGMHVNRMKAVHSS